MYRTIRRGTAGAALAALALAAHSAAQDGPQANLVLAGYGSAAHTTLFETGDLPTSQANDFTAAVSPVILFQLGDNLLFETELEFGLSGEATTTSLEYAQVNYLGFERVILTAGKFLMPFGLFSERLHPTWINKLPNAPLLYGHAHGGVAEDALLPILSDAGLMARMSQPVGSRWGLDFTVFITQGPQTAVAGASGDGHAHDRLPANGPELSADRLAPPEANLAIVPAEVPTVAFGTSFSDNNDNKLVGGRLGLVNAPVFEVYLSGFHSMYDAENYLDMFGANVSADLRLGRYELRAEGTQVWQELQDGAAFPVLRKPGYYAQLSRTFGNLEPVLRWGHLLRQEVDGVLISGDRKRMAVGLNYWIGPTSPVKVMFEWDSLDHDHVMLQWAMGF